MTQNASERIRVRIGAASVDVPAGASVFAALESAGQLPPRVDGCRGGACGACLVSVSSPGRFPARTVLACATTAEDGFWIGAVPADRRAPAAYDLASLSADGASLRAVYPELASCSPCGACSSRCPQGLDVSGYMAAIRSGDLARAATLSLECTSCTACASACPEGLHPYRYAVLARRLHARHGAPPPSDLGERVAACADGTYDDELRRLASHSEEALASAWVAARSARSNGA